MILHRITQKHNAGRKTIPESNKKLTNLQFQRPLNTGLVAKFPTGIIE